MIMSNTRPTPSGIEKLLQCMKIQEQKRRLEQEQVEKRRQDKENSDGNPTDIETKMKKEKLRIAKIFQTN